MSQPRQQPHPSLPSPWSEAIDPGCIAPPPWTQDPAPPVIWSIAGSDSGGGAGLSADTRAAAALGVHLCPVLAAVTAQNSLGVQALFPLPRGQLRAQLLAMAGDMPPRVIKTGLLASVEALRVVAETVDALRERLGPVALVVDPVLGATAGGSPFATQALIQAYRELLLPRASLLTPNRREAERLLGVQPGALGVPALAAALRRLGPASVCITGGDDVAPGATAEGQDLALDWWDGAVDAGHPELGELRGWLALPRLATRHHHGSGCTFASAAAAALARGFAPPDAALLAKMLSWRALRDGHAAGAGAGPLRPGPGFIDDAEAMPVMSFGDEPLDASTRARWGQVLRRAALQPAADFAPGLYAIADSAARAVALAASGRFAHVQLRAKRAAPSAGGAPPEAEADAEDQRLRGEIRATLVGCLGSGAQLWINDHAALALAEGDAAPEPGMGTGTGLGLHLGQEDWGALPAGLRTRLLRRSRDGRLRLGLSSHSLWELARARGLAPSYIACGPIWPTTTKAMPWRPQGLDNLAWWVRMAGAPVVAIGGVLSPAQLQACQASGAAAVCLVRGADDVVRSAVAAVSPGPSQQAAGTWRSDSGR